MRNLDRLIKIFFGLWLICFVCSFSLPLLLEAKGDGFTRGLNRLGALMGWQFGATVFAFLGFITGIGKLGGRRGMTWLSRGPAIVQATLIATLVCLIVYMRFASKPPAETEYFPPKAATAPAATIVPDATGTNADVAQTETYSGIYHRGFETSHFYSSDGQGKSEIMGLSLGHGAVGDGPDEWETPEFQGLVINGVNYLIAIPKP